MSWTTVLEKEFEGRKVIAQSHSEGGWKVTAPATTDEPPSVQVDGTSTMMGIPQEKGKNYSVEAEDLEGLRKQLIDYDFSEDAADQIISELEGL